MAVPMATSQLDERATVLAAQSGDERALESLVRWLAPELMPLASTLAGGTGEADALLGDALSRVCERIGQVERPEAIYSWARRILVRRFLDERRWLRRRPRCSIEGIEIAAPQNLRPDLIDLRGSIARLPRRDRALLVLHYWSGFSIRECAEELGIATGTAKSRLNAALRRLRREMGEET
jgi:RNA polymerase sigma factor (sigma-70 family)